jgi:hypothetical protein
MQRRLEDVSHFFFDHREPVQNGQTLSRGTQRAEPRPRIIHVASLGDELTAGIIVAGLAASATSLGRRVLVAETHEQPFGIAFGVGIPTPRDGARVVEAASGLWVSLVPLLGGRRPGALLDPSASAEWQARATQADLVLVHVNYRDGGLRTPGMPIPDEFLVVTGDGAPDGPVHAYRAIKRAVSSNPSLELGLIAVGEPDEVSGRAHNALVRAVAAFLGRGCPVVGAVPSLSALPHGFIAGADFRDGLDEMTRAVRTIAVRWTAPDGNSRPRTMLASGRSANAVPPASGHSDERRRGGIG